MLPTHPFRRNQTSFPAPKPSPSSYAAAAHNQTVGTRRRFFSPAPQQGADRASVMNPWPAPRPVSRPASDPRPGPYPGPASSLCPGPRPGPRTGPRPTRRTANATIQIGFVAAPRFFSSDACLKFPTHYYELGRNRATPGRVPQQNPRAPGRPAAREERQPTWQRTCSA